MVVLMWLISCCIQNMNIPSMITAPVNSRRAVVTATLVVLADILHVAKYTVVGVIPSYLYYI